MCDVVLSTVVQLPHDEILGIMQPYIAPVVGEYTDWTPLHERETLFEEDIDKVRAPS
eukprot:SAG31_NODE_1854_length_7065_cov_43.480764_3_plen_57_part_00